jgi:EAL domain-containing protein (putative c-di-GMP-specific phosphodiesterase class I)
MNRDRELLTTLAKIRKSPQGIRAVHFFSSWCKNDSEFETKAEIAISIIEKSLSVAANSSVFFLECGDIIFVFSQMTTSSLAMLVAELEKLFFPDGLPSQKNIYGETRCQRTFDVGRELSALVEGVRTIVCDNIERINETNKTPIGIKQLQFISDTLQRANIRSIVFNQPVYFIEHSKSSIEFIEFYVSIKHLEEALCPGFSVSANPWLFNLVKENLDLSLLRMLPSDITEYRHKAFSINLSISTFLSPDFLTFMNAIPSRLSGRVYAEIHKTDLIEHSGLINRIAQRSLDMNVPVCIDGLSALDFRLLRLSHLHAAFVKVRWGDEIASLSQDEIGLLVREIRNNSHVKVVLTRCDSPKAFAFARALGIGYVQGRLADEYFKIGERLAG